MVQIDYDQRLVEIRLANLSNLLRETKLSQKALAEKTGVTQAVVSQYMRRQRPLGRVYCRKIEQALNLPQGGMDHENMQIPLEPLPATVPQMTLAQARILDGLSPLQLAVVDTFAKAARSKAVTDAWCADLISRIVTLQSKAAETGPA